MKRLLTLFVICCVTALAQGNVSRISEQPADLGFQTIYAHSGNLLTYKCLAPSRSGSANTITITSVSNASPASFTATAHGLDYQSGATITALVEVRGATGAWAGLNGVWIATPTSANAFTIPVDTSMFGTFSGQTITVTTRAARTTDSVWAIWHGIYDGSNNLIWSGWAAGASNSNADSNSVSGGGPSFTFACASRTTYGYE